MQPDPEIPKIKLAKPDNYDGSPEKLNKFVHKCNLYLASKDYTPRQCVLFAISFMKTGKALIWAQAKLTELAKKLTWDYSWEDCMKDLCSAFRDCDVKATAQSKIKNVKQGTSSVSTYIINFEEYEYNTGYNKEALINLFVSGLAFHITRPIFSSQIPPDALIKWKCRAVVLD